MPNFVLSTDGIARNFGSRSCTRLASFLVHMFSELQSTTLERHPPSVVLWPSFPVICSALHGKQICTPSVSIRDASASLVHSCGTYACCAAQLSGKTRLLKENAHKNSIPGRSSLASVYELHYSLLSASFQHSDPSALLDCISTMYPSNMISCHSILKINLSKLILWL